MEKLTTRPNMTAQQKKKIYKLNAAIAYVERFTEKNPCFPVPAHNDPRLEDGNRTNRYGDESVKKYFFCRRLINRYVKEVRFFD